MKYKIIVDKQPRSNPSDEKKEYEIDIEELRVKGDVYDSLVITRAEDYVMRRLSLSEYHVLTVLDEPIKEPIPELNIELFEGDNYIYLVEMEGNKFYAEYLIKNDFTDLYVTEIEMHSAIQQTADEIKLEVSKKISSDDGGVELASLIRQTAELIYMTANNFGWESLNSSMTTDGFLTATGGNIGGFNLGKEIFSSNLKLNNTYTQEDANRIRDIIMGDISPTPDDYEKYDLNRSGTFNSMDYANVINLINGKDSGKGTFILNSTDSKNAIQIIDEDDNKVITNIGLYGSYFRSLSAINCYITGDSFYYDSSNNTTIIISPETGEIHCVSLSQTSLAENKKNFEKLENALDIINKIDIYKYNLKNEKDGTKKHIGFVIGDNYKYAEEVTNTDNNGAEIYSLASICLQAIQEQQEQIKELQGKIERLENSKNI